MSDSLWKTSLGEFHEAIASTAPTPGGGSVAAVSATFGAGLVIMALEISASRKDATRIEEIRKLISVGRKLMELLAADADADVSAFRAYMAALKLPKQDDEEKARRREAMHAASRGATEAPIAAGLHIVAALRLAEEAAPVTHPHVLSDVGAGAGLLHGALTAVLLNVDVNLPSLADPTLKAAFAEQRGGLEEEGREVAARVLARVAEGLGR